MSFHVSAGTALSPEEAAQAGKLVGLVLNHTSSSFSGPSTLSNIQTCSTAQDIPSNELVESRSSVTSRLIVR